MNTYKVKITETLEKEVEVEAEDRHEAEQIVSDWDVHSIFALMTVMNMVRG